MEIIVITHCTTVGTTIVRAWPFGVFHFPYYFQIPTTCTMILRKNPKRYACSEQSDKLYQRLADFRPAQTEF